MTGRPSRSRPSVTGSSRSSPDHRSSSSSSRSSTTRDLGFGTSTPTMSRPGMRATRIERALILRARSSARVTSRFILTPGAEPNAVLGHHRARGPPGHVALDLELGQRLLEPLLQRVELAFAGVDPLVRGASSSSTSQTGPSPSLAGARRGSAFLAPALAPSRVGLAVALHGLPGGLLAPSEHRLFDRLLRRLVLAADRRLGSAFGPIPPLSLPRVRAARAAAADATRRWRASAPRARGSPPARRPRRRSPAGSPPRRSREWPRPTVRGAAG